MARYERNRGMFFGSWTGNAIPADFEITKGDSTGITEATFVQNAGQDTFADAVNGSGEYIFTYDENGWVFNGEHVQLTAYGISVTGTPAVGDIIDVNYTEASGGWEALGKDNDDLTKDLNPDTESSKNVLGESTFRHTGYEPSVSVDPYYIDPSRKMYKRILQNAMEERFGEGELKGYFAEAFFTTANKESRIMTGYCYVREAWFVPQSFGGDTAGLAIPVEIHPVGAVKKKKITYLMENNEATITDFE